MATTKPRGGRLDLSAVHPEFRPLARAIHKDPRLYVGRLVWLVPMNADGKPELPEAFQLPDPQMSMANSILTIWREERDNQLVYAFAYNQAARDTSLEAGFATLLKTCAAHGIRLGGIAMDIGSGREPERPAITELETALRDGTIKVVVTPLLHRIDPDQEHFSARMPRWARWGVLTYYARKFGEIRLDYMFWPDFDARERGVRIVQLGEQYLGLLREGWNRLKAHRRAKPLSEEVNRDG